MFNDVLIAYFVVAIIICLIGVCGIVLCCVFTTKAASKISRDITINMSKKIEDNIRRDIDSGRFYY